MVALVWAPACSATRGAANITSTSRVLRSGATSVKKLGTTWTTSSIVDTAAITLRNWCVQSVVYYLLQWMIQLFNSCKETCYNAFGHGLCSYKSNKNIAITQYIYYLDTLIYRGICFS